MANGETRLDPVRDGDPGHASGILVDGELSGELKGHLNRGLGSSGDSKTEDLLLMGSSGDLEIVFNTQRGFERAAGLTEVPVRSVSQALSVGRQGSAVTMVPEVGFSLTDSRREPDQLGESQESSGLSNNS